MLPQCTETWEKATRWKQLTTLTLPELKQRLATKDLDELCELLGLDPETMVELCTDIITDKYDELCAEVSDIDEFMPDDFRV
jgi:hypothetical protein